MKFVNSVAKYGTLGASIWVVANDAPAEIKSFATDLQATGYPVYVCDGVDDDVEINAAIVALPGDGGTVQLSTGTFTLGAQILIARGAVYLKGEGGLLQGSRLLGSAIAAGAVVRVAAVGGGIDLESFMVQGVDGGASGPEYGIELETTPYVSLKNIYSQYTRIHGLYGHDTVYYIYIDKCRFTQTYTGAGAHLVASPGGGEQVNNVSVINSRFSSNLTGLAINGNGIRLTGNAYEGNEIGLEIGGSPAGTPYPSTGVVSHGEYFEGNSVAALRVGADDAGNPVPAAQGTMGLSIAGNSLSLGNVTGDGIVLSRLSTGYIGSNYTYRPAGNAAGRSIYSINVGARVTMEPPAQDYLSTFGSAKVIGRQIPGMLLEGENIVEGTTTSTGAVDITSVAGLNIPATTPLLIMFQARKTVGAAAACQVGLKLNATQVVSNAAFTDAGNSARAQGAVLFIIPRDDALYTGGAGLAGVMGLRTGDNLAASIVEHGNNAMPAAAITSVTVTGLSGDAAITTAVNNLRVYTLPIYPTLRYPP